MKLFDCCLSIADGDHQPPPKSESGVPFVTISDIKENHFNYSHAMCAPINYYEKLDKRRQARTGDVLYSVVGSFGIPILIQDDSPFVFQRHIAILRPNPEIIDSRYLFYTMLGTDFYQKADAVALGAAQRTISLTSLRNIDIAVPNLKYQHRIADILSAYDDLIENNRKQIALLEEAAQRLYKEWFVDFRFPGHETAEWENGLPKGWKRGALDNIAIENGKGEKKQNRNRYSCYLPIDRIPAHSLCYFETNDVCMAESSLVSFSPGDIIFGAMRPYFHKVSIARHHGLTRSTCFVLNAIELRNWAYLVMLLFSDEAVAYATQVSVGATMPYVRWTDLKKMEIIIPSQHVTGEFQKRVAALLERQQKLASAIVDTTSARDSLLPKLMSGKIEVTA